MPTLSFLQLAFLVVLAFLLFGDVSRLIGGVKQFSKEFFDKKKDPSKKVGKGN